MMKLNNEQAQTAWEDFEEYLKNIGLVTEKQNTHLAKMAFTMGFTMGQASIKTETIAEKVEVEDAPEQQKHVMNRKRTHAEIENDARLVSSIMQRNGKVMQLQEITEAVNAAGGNWYPKSASGHMVKVMERYPVIKKVGYGVYEYQKNGGGE